MTLWGLGSWINKKALRAVVEEVSPQHPLWRVLSLLVLGHYCHELRTQPYPFDKTAQTFLYPLVVPMWESTRLARPESTQPGHCSLQLLQANEGTLCNSNKVEGQKVNSGQEQELITLKAIRKVSQACLLTPLILALGKKRQEDCCKLETSLIYIVTSKNPVLHNEIVSIPSPKNPLKP